jgi:hypothetical protein
MVRPGARTMTFESLSDPVDVLSAFVDGRLRPLRFRWQGKVIRVHRITGEWHRREGSALLRYFSVESRAADTYELCYDPRGPRWIMSRAWTPPAS